MPLRLRRVLLSLPVLLITGLAAVYLLAGWFAFEPLAKWAVHKLVDERSGYRLEMEHAKFDPIRLSVDLRGVTLAEPAGKPLLTLARLFVDAESRGLLSRTLTFEQVRLVRPVASVELGTDGRLNWLTFIAAVTRNDKAQPTASRESLPRLVIRHFALDSGRIDLADHSIPGGFSTQVDPLNLQLDELSTLPDDTGRHSILARTGLGTDIRWTGSFGLNPVTAAGEIVVNNVSLAWLRPYLETVLGSARVDGNAGLNLGYRAGYANKRFSLQLHDVGAKANRLTLSGGTDADPAVTLDSIALNGGRVDFDNRRVDIGRIAIEGGKVRVVRAVDGKLDVQEWLTRTKSAKRSESVNPANTATTPSTSTRWQVSLGHGDVDRVSLRFIDHGFTAPLAAEAAALKLAFKADATAGDGPFDMKVQALDLGLDGIRLVSGKAGEPWLQVAHAALQNAHASLSSREFGAERVRLSEGRLTASRDAHGRLSLSDVLNRASTGSAASASNSEPGWRYRVDKIEADRFGVRWREESVAPAAMFALEDIEVGAERFSDDPKAVMPVRIAMRVGTGGRGEARGTVMPATGATELQLALHGLNLVPLQPVLSQVADLTLVRGQAETEGTLHYASGQARYEASFALHDVLLNEERGKEPFLAWKRMSTPRLVATQQRLNIGDVELSGLATKLVIFKDRTINLTKVFHPKPPAGSPQQQQPVREASAQANDSPSTPSYGVNIRRLRLIDSRLDFTDLSLALPFHARIDRLEGQVAGLSTQPGRSAQVELAGQVDDYGLARAVGKIELSNPTDAMDIKAQFRNVEMTSLTPYSATFAGRKINSGKLSLDLDYKLQRRQLTGDNRIVMDKLTLGERVQSPTAIDLPLDLALAILKDANGRIDLGLPVSGSLDDPQFSYGALIGKALASAIGKIITAPFRAIGALFGGKDKEETPKIAFDAGNVALLPPEREKLDRLAKALALRPGLALSVRAAYNPKSDANAMALLQVRRDVARQLGQDVRADEDPGPFSTTQPDVRKAIQAIYARTFGDDALQALRRQHQQANPPKDEGNARPRLASGLAKLLKPKEEPLRPEVAERLHGTELHEAMVQRLLERDMPGEEQLTALASRRAGAIRQQLASNGVAPERVQLQPTSVEDSAGTVVHTRLELAVAGEVAEAAGK